MAQNREIMIVRQSQIKIAMELFEKRDLKPTIIELLAVTDHLVQYVENGLDKDIIDKSKKVESFLQAKKNTK